MSDDPRILTVDEATSLLPDGDYVHTFIQGGPVLIGADWDRSTVIDAFSRARKVELSGPAARQARHGIALTESSGRIVFIATDTARLDALDPVTS